MTKLLDGLYTYPHLQDMFNTNKDYSCEKNLSTDIYNNLNLLFNQDIIFKKQQSFLPQVRSRNKAKAVIDIHCLTSDQTHQIIEVKTMNVFSLSKFVQALQQLQLYRFLLNLYGDNNIKLYYACNVIPSLEAMMFHSKYHNDVELIIFTKNCIATTFSTKRTTSDIKG